MSMENSVNLYFRSYKIRVVKRKRIIYVNVVTQV